MTIYRDDLEKVYALIEKPENWTQNWLARDSKGLSIDPESENAICWCAIGAFMKCGLANEEHEAAWVLVTRILMPQADVDAMVKLGKPGGIAAFNDAPERTHAEVLELLRSAIERAPVRT